MKRHLASPRAIQAHQERRAARLDRHSVAPENSGLDREEVEQVLRSLGRSGYKVPTALKPKAPS